MAVDFNLISLRIFTTLGKNQLTSFHAPVSPHHIPLYHWTLPTPIGPIAVGRIPQTRHRIRSKTTHHTTLDTPRFAEPNAVERKLVFRPQLSCLVCIRQRRHPAHSGTSPQRQHLQSRQKERLSHRFRPILAANLPRPKEIQHQRQPQ